MEPQELEDIIFRAMLRVKKQEEEERQKRWDAWLDRREKEIAASTEKILQDFKEARQRKKKHWWQIELSPHWAEIEKAAKGESEERGE